MKQNNNITRTYRHAANDESAHDRLPLSLSTSLLIASGVFVNACIVAGIFHQDTRWLLGKVSLEIAARDAIICVTLFLAVSLILLFSCSCNIRKRYGWRAYFQSFFLLVGSLLLITLGLLAQSRAFVQYFTSGMFALSGTSFFLWALLPFAGFIVLNRSL